MAEGSRDLLALLKKSGSQPVALEARQTLAPKSLSLTLQPSQSDFESLTVRRRKFILSQPVRNRAAQRRFYVARCRLKGVLLWKKVLGEIQVFGTTSSLLDIYQAYKQNLESVMQSKERQPREHSEEAVELRWLIHPDARCKQLWNSVILLLLLYSFTVVPFIIAFSSMDPGSLWYYLDISTSALFFLDILLMFNTAIQDEEKLITNRGVIAWKYATGMLVIDILSVFPFFAFETGTGSGNSNVFLRFLRLSRFTRLFRTSKLVAVIRHFSHSQRMEQCINFLQTYSGITRLIAALFVVCIIIHFVACMWYFMARMNDFSPDTWVVRNDLQDASQGVLYLTSVYFAVTTLTTVGYGDVTPHTDSELVLCMIWMMFGVGFYSFVVGTLSSVLTSMDTKSVLLNSKLQLVDLLAKDTRLPDHLLKLVRKEIKHSAEIIALDESQRQSLIMHLPKTLKYDIAMTMYQYAATTIAFFLQQDKAFAANILPLLTHVTKQSRDFVYRKGDYADEMYFIVAGRVNYVYGAHNYVFKSIVRGSYFGEIELLEQRPRDFSVMTEESCSFFVMNKGVRVRQLFDSVLVEYPKVAEALVTTSESRKARNLQALQELADLLEVVEIRKESTYEDLAGKTSLTQGAVNETIVGTEEQEEGLRSKLIIEDMQSECRRLQGAVADVQRTASKILDCLQDRPRRLPPLVKT